MNINKINEELPKLKEISSNIENICLGKKIKDGIVTNDLSVVYVVKEKKDLSEIPESELIPSEVSVDNNNFKTDVIEIPVFNINPCPTEFTTECEFSPVPNKSYIRPLQGGISIRKTSDGIGTLGFFAKHTPTGALVGVSNAHVLRYYPLSVSNWCDDTDCITNYNTLSEYVYQPGESSSYETEQYKIGRVMYSYPLSTSSSQNKADVAILAVSESVISGSDSYKQYGLSMNQPPEFATTEEIDSIITNNIPLAASGRSTGPKEGDLCGLSILQSNISILVSQYRHNKPGYSWTLPFSEQMTYTRINSDCPDPSIPGDSGSAVLGNFSGTWKIVGLNFAGGTTGSGIDIGVFNRIDKVAEFMQIESWDGGTTNFIDFDNPEYFTVSGQDSDLTKDVGGEVYWQAGLS